MSALPRHALSSAFPDMSLSELQSLATDIENHGLKQPIVTYQGAVLDGWHRYAACETAGVEPRFVEFDGADLVAFVLSQNAHRRHLTASQRAAAIVACSDWKPARRQTVEEKSAPGAGLSDAELAKAADVSERTIRDAKAAKRGGAGELVRDDKVSAKQGAAMAKLPPKERTKALKDPEAWQASLERKTPPKEPTPEQEADLDDASERMADLAADYEEALRIFEADDKLAEAWTCVKEMRAKHDQLEKLYNAQRIELANMTREAKRHMRKAEGAEGPKSVDNQTERGVHVRILRGVIVVSDGGRGIDFVSANSKRELGAA